MQTGNRTREQRKVRYAVVGAGNIAQVAVLPAFEHATENSELVAVVSGDPVKRRELRDRYQLESTGGYDDLERVLRRGRVDAVYVAVPNTQHRAICERAARAGAHVLCEKPMAMRSSDCEAMIRACDAGGVKLMIAYRLHFDEANLGAIDVVQAGRIGEPRAFASTFTQQVRPGDIRTRDDTGGGALFDLGIYCLNAARYLFRDEPETVFGYAISSGDPRFSPGVDQTTAAVLRFPNDRLAQFLCSQAAASVSRFRLVGTKGDLVLEPAYDFTTELTCHLSVEGETQTRTFPKHDQFAAELAYFSRCILDDEEPEPSGEEGLADVRVLEAIAASAKRGVPIELAPFHRVLRPGHELVIRKPPVSPPKPIRAPSPSVK